MAEQSLDHGLPAATYFFCTRWHALCAWHVHGTSTGLRI